jgi:hypothetical protein
MTKTILVSCLAASFLLSGAAIAPSWAVTGDLAKSNQIIFADGDQTEEAAPQEEQGGDRDSHLINTQSSFDIAQAEEGGAAEPKPEEGGEGGSGGGD